MSADDLGKKAGWSFNPPAAGKRQSVPPARFEPPVPTPLKEKEQAPAADPDPVLGETPRAKNNPPSSPWIPPSSTSQIAESEEEVPFPNSPTNVKPRSSLDAYVPPKSTIKPQLTGSKFAALASQKDAEIARLKAIIEGSALTPEEQQFLDEKDRTIARLRQLVEANKAARDSLPRDSRMLARHQALARSSQDHPDTFPLPQTQLLSSVLGSTGTEVNSLSLAHTSKLSPTDAFYNMLAQSTSAHFTSDPNNRIEAHAAYNAIQHQDLVKAQLQKAISSESDWADFVRDRQLLSPLDPNFMTNSQLVSYVQTICQLAQDKAEGWKVAKVFLEKVFREIGLNRTRLHPVSLQELLGPFPSDGNFKTALGRCPLFQATIQEKYLHTITAAPVKESSKLQSLKLQNQKLQLQYKSAKKNSKPDAADGFPGSPFKTEAFPKYCKYHNGWFNSHGSEDCKFKANSSVRRRPGDVSGATAPSL